MRNILLTLSYLGTRYHGFQVQKNALSVAQVLQDAMETLLGRREDIKGCSRTDAGVHASFYCVSFRTESDLPLFRIQRGLNGLLPWDISVQECREVPEDFHARYSSRGKRYRYRIWNSPARSPFWEGRAYAYYPPLDLEKARAVCAAYEGRHDFSAFCSAGCDVANTVRTIYRCGVEREGSLVTFTVEGDGFLYNMVRIMVGTMFWVNEGKLSVQEIPELLQGAERRRAGRTAPAQGLYLDRVFYDMDGFRREGGDDGGTGAY
ncbi:MAG: tRNA pseudouridine(38-40) synthase TruA [Oscillospiraceae bacterium]|nr:tRNA pseudouridine(38-40) synthase TruA [Oscillospiraceae bacterium]MDY4192345.1 tRNA pseudouridine(38-40) synthase TruA [Oscillospiraceae bacterium]